MILRRGLRTLSFQIAQLACLVATSVLLTRAIGVRGFGIYVLVATLVSLINLVTSLGVNAAGIFHLGQLRHDQSSTASTMLAAGLLSGGASTILWLVLCAALAHSFLHELSRTIMALALVVLPIGQLANTYAYTLLGLNLPARFASINFTQVATALVLQLCLTVTGRLTLLSALTAWAFGNGLSLIVAATQVGFRLHVRPVMRRDVMRDLVGYGLKGYLANTMTFFNYRLDSLVVNAVLGAAGVGLYAIAVSMAELLWYGANAVGAVVFPYVSSVPRAEADRQLPVILRATVLVTLVAAVVESSLAGTIIRVAFGPSALPALTPFLLLLPGVIALAAAKVIASYLSGIGLPIYATYIAAASLILSIGLDLTLIPIAGIGGAAVASSVVYMFSAVAFVARFSRSAGLTWAEALLPRLSDLRSSAQLLRSAAPKGQGESGP